ncbi:MAG: FkbM family methyltransferase [Sandaracinus sp.]
MILVDLARLARVSLGHPLARRAPLGTAARIARWQLGSRLLACPVVVPFASGTKLVVERGMTGATGNVYFGLHEVEDMAFVTHALRASDLFVDVGANVGSYTVLAGGVSGARVIACEPIAATRARLERNVAVNQLQARTRVEAVAVSDHDGTVSMTSDRDTMNTVALEGGVEVPARTLDTLLAGEVPRVLKVDVEGHEAAVLRGASRTLASEGLEAIVLEPGGSEVDFVRATLASHGFEAHRYDPFARELVATVEGSVHNILFVRRGALAAVRERCRSAPPIELGFTRV